MKLDSLDSVLTIGTGGMIGSYVDFGFCPDESELDILDKTSVDVYVEKHAPSAIILLAGATDMKRTEAEPLYAYELNVRGVYNVAQAAAKAEIRMVYISTSRVFKGNKEEPYTEEDTPEPEGYYACTKYFGEQIVTSLVPDHIIVRTAWVFGGGSLRDNKFYGNVIRQFDKPEIVALNDVYGSPTYGKDLVATIKDLLAKGESGLFHIVNDGVATRYDLAKYMASELRSEVVVKPVDRSYFHGGDALPTNEAVVSKRCSLRPWQEALTEYLTEEWKPYI